MVSDFHRVPPIEWHTAFRATWQGRAFASLHESLATMSPELGCAGAALIGRLSEYHRMLGSSPSAAAAVLWKCARLDAERDRNLNRLHELAEERARLLQGSEVPNG